MDFVTAFGLFFSGVGLVFMFSWLLMILVTLSFLVGAPVERYLCQGLVEPYDGLKVSFFVEIMIYQAFIKGKTLIIFIIIKKQME